jgi:hypothetical protein
MAELLLTRGCYPRPSRPQSRGALIAGLAVVALFLMPSIAGASNVPMPIHPGSGIRSISVPATSPGIAPTWTQLSSRPSPPGVSDAMMTFDGADGYVLLFGGTNGSTGAVFNQTWSYRAGSWTQLHPRLSPPARSDGMMAYDPKDKHVVLFGGQGTGGTFFNDTWLFAGGQWSDSSNTTGLPPLAGGSMTFDYGSRHLLLFGGWDDPCSCVDWVYNSLYSFTNYNWTLVHEKGANSSLMGQSSSIAYDPKRESVLEFGGYNPRGTNPGTWNYSHGRWTELSLTRSPSWRVSDNLIFDPRLGHIILFGGVSLNSTPSPNDTWKYSNGAWVQLHPAQSPPAENAPAAAAYDAADGYLVLFGGQGLSGGPGNDTWVFS